MRRTFPFLCFLILAFVSLTAQAGAVVDDYIEGVVLKGENAKSILTQYMTPDAFHRMYAATKGVYDLSRIKQDYTYEIIVNEDEGLKVFTYQFNRHKKVVIRATRKGYSAVIRSADYEIIPRGFRLKGEDEAVGGAVPLVAAKADGTGAGRSVGPSVTGPTMHADAPSAPVTEAGSRSAVSSPSVKERRPDVTMIPDIPLERKKEFDAEVRIDDDVKRGEHAQAIFLHCMDVPEFAKVCRQTRKVYDLGNLRVGQPYSLVYRDQTGFVSFGYQIDKQRVLTVTKDGKTGRYEAKVETLPFDIRLAVVKGKVTSSLFKSIAEVGENPNLGVLMADIFKSEINFIRDIRKGDTFVIAVEKMYVNNRFQHYGRIIGLRFVNRGTTFEGYRFPYDGAERYFNAKGESLAKAMLKTPLKFSRISSHFSLGRKHPIFKDVRKHMGVDYAAPEGTPVNAVGAGTVTKVGWSTGFGKTVVIQHLGGLESQYAHLSRYASGLKEGQMVGQGQLIGYVGQTGWATGPHLDFRLRKGGKFINPEQLISTRMSSVPKKDMRRFNEQKKFVQSILDGKYKRSLYKPGMLHLSAH